MKNINSKQAVIYSRTATNEDAVQKINEQEKGCRKKLELLGYKIVGILRDIAKSGANMNRPAMRILTDLIKAKRIDAVCVADSDRISRNIEDYLEFTKLCQKENVSLLSVNSWGKAQVARARTKSFNKVFEIISKAYAS